MATAAIVSVTPRNVFVTLSTVSLSPSECSRKTPANAIGMEPTQSHRTSSHRTVPRRTCTPPPTGFITMAATRSDETAVVGEMPKKITRIGVINAPPPMPVNPTVKPTMAEAKTIARSICNARSLRTPRRRRRRRPCPANVPRSRDNVPRPGAGSHRSNGRRRTFLEFAPALEGLRERDLVGVLEVAADGKTAREARHPHAERLEERRDVHRRRVSLEVGVRRDDHLGHALAFDSVEELLHAQVLGADAVERADRAAEHVVPAADHGRLLDRRRVLRFLDDAQHLRIAAGVPTDAAALALGDVAALLAERDLLLGADQRLGEALGVVGRLLHDVEGEPLGRLRPDARQPRELVDEVLDRAL